MYYIVSRSAFASALTRGFAVKVKVTTNISIESSSCKVLSQVQVPSPLYLKMSYFTSKEETPADSYWRETIGYNVAPRKDDIN